MGIIKQIKTRLSSIIRKIRGDIFEERAYDFNLSLMAPIALIIDPDGKTVYVEEGVSAGSTLEIGKRKILLASSKMMDISLGDDSIKGWIIDGKNAFCIPNNPVIDSKDLSIALMRTEGDRRALDPKSLIDRIKNINVYQVLKYLVYAFIAWKASPVLYKMVMDLIGTKSVETIVVNTTKTLIELNKTTRLG